MLLFFPILITLSQHINTWALKNKNDIERSKVTYRSLNTGWLHDILFNEQKFLKSRYALLQRTDLAWVPGSPYTPDLIRRFLSIRRTFCNAIAKTTMCNIEGIAQIKDLIYIYNICGPEVLKVKRPVRSMIFWLGAFAKLKM